VRWILRGDERKFRCYQTEHEAESAWRLADTLQRVIPAKERILDRDGWYKGHTYNCFDTVRVKIEELVVCVLARFVPFCFALLLLLALWSLLVYFEPGCIVIAIGAVEPKISRFVSAREHGHRALLCLEWAPVPGSQPIRYGSYGVES
jgi:hypothetical protein